MLRMEPQKAPGKAPEKAPGRVPGRVPGRAPEKVLGKVPVRAPGGLPWWMATGVQGCQCPTLHPPLRHVPLPGSRARRHSSIGSATHFDHSY